jgi:Cdc6-like AAA superfamily ATPase
VSPSQFLDQAIALNTVTLMQQTLQTKEWKLIAGTFVFLVSIDGMRKLVTTMVSKGITKMCEMSVDDWSTLFSNCATGCLSLATAPARIAYSGVCIPYRYAHKKLYPPVLKEADENDTRGTSFDTKTLELSCSTGMIKILSESSNLVYRSSITNVQYVGNGTEIIQTEQWSDMIFTHPEYRIVFVTPVEMVYSVKTSSSGIVTKTFTGASSLTQNGTIDPHSFSWSQELQQLPKEPITHWSKFVCCFVSFVGTESKQTVQKCSYSVGVKDVSVFTSFPKKFHSIIHKLLNCLFDSNDGILGAPNADEGGKIECAKFATFPWVHVEYKNKQIAGALDDLYLFKLLQQFYFKTFGTTQKYNSCFSIFLISQWILLLLIANSKYMYYMLLLKTSKLRLIGVDHKDQPLFVNMPTELNFCTANWPKVFPASVPCNQSQLLNTVYPVIQIIESSVSAALMHEFRTFLLMEMEILTSDSKSLDLRTYYKEIPATPVSQQPTTKSSSSSGENSLYLSVQVDSFVPYVSNDQAAQKFINEISKVSAYHLNSVADLSSKDIDQLKVKTHYIQIIEEVNTTTVPNPAYQEWKELISTLGLTPSSSSNEGMSINEKHFDDEKSSSVSPKSPMNTFVKEVIPHANISTGLYSGLFQSIPPATKQQTTKLCKVDCQELNRVYKRFNTLYLQTADKQRLFNCLDNFKNRKQLLQELGFPIKLGVLLYGVPGTGKTATISAIASYLQKDLFYVDLRTVKSNKQLKMIFDHILHINTNGGIVVLEDIDANSDVVLQRSSIEECEKSTTSVVADTDDKLTLDYILNVLQGSLTRDNTIFIITTNYVDKLDSALIRDGRIDVKIEMKLCNRDQLRDMWKTIFQREICEEVCLKFQEYQFTPASVLSRCQQYLCSGGEVVDAEILQPFLE